MAFKDVLGHSRPITLLQRAIRNVDGGGGEGGEACDHCLSCKKIDHALHPDVLLIEPEGQTIKVDQVRQLQKELVYRPYEGKRRVCILTAADRMAPHIPNTLLKTLEEPPLHTVIILLANNSRFILPTILSRCQPIRFNPLPISLVSKWLMEGKGLNETEAHLLASLSDGSPGKALEIQEEICQIPREELLKDWIGSKSLSFKKMGNWVESLPSQRENLLLILEVAKTLLRDLVIVKALKKETKLIHSDLWQVMEPLSANWSLPSLLKRMEILHHTSLAIRGNANTGLALEAMMLSWAE